MATRSSQASLQVSSVGQKQYAPLHEIYTDLYHATKEQMHKLHDLGY
jgi:hypothetical protein